MAFYNNRSIVLDRGAKRGSRRPLGPVGHRLAGVMRKPEGPDHETNSVAPPGEADTFVEASPQRFPLVLRGYDRLAVDAYVSELEAELAGLDQELAELRGEGAAAHEVASEIKRIGEQTSAVLMAAHEQRERILSEARAEADRCVNDANTTANARTKECEDRLRVLGAQTKAAQSERDRLLGDLRAISAGLAAVADSAHERAAAS